MVGPNICTNISWDYYTPPLTINHNEYTLHNFVDPTARLRHPLPLPRRPGGLSLGGVRVWRFHRPPTLPRWRQRNLHNLTLSLTHHGLDISLINWWKVNIWISYLHIWTMHKLTRVTKNNHKFDSQNKWKYNIDNIDSTNFTRRKYMYRT